MAGVFNFLDDYTLKAAISEWAQVSSEYGGWVTVKVDAPEHDTSPHSVYSVRVVPSQRAPGWTGELRMGPNRHGSFSVDDSDPKVTASRIVQGLGIEWVLLTLEEDE